MINNINKPRLVGEKALKPVTIAPKTEVKVVEPTPAPKKVVKRRKKSKK